MGILKRQQALGNWAEHLGYLLAAREGGMKSRWAEWHDAKKTTPPMPDPGPMAYMTDIFAKSGRHQRGGMDIAPLNYAEIAAFAHVEGLDAWDCRIIRLMSEAFVTGLQRGKDVFALPPGDQD